MLPDGSKPRTGVKIPGLTCVLAGPWAAQLLADFGAGVIKLERPAGGGDCALPPYWASLGAVDPGRRLGN